MALRVEKPYYQFNKGINTEGSLIAFPEGFSADEENYDLRIDGSRRRRMGLSLEAGGELAPVVSELSASTPKAVRSHKWEGVAGNLSLNYKLVQVGTELYIYEDTGTVLSSNKRSATINLLVYKVTSSTDAEVSESFVDVTFGRGDAFVVSKHTDPFYIRYDGVTDTFTTSDIAVSERDFEGVEDGIALTSNPTTDTATHRYNLQNRGWTDQFINDYFTNQSSYPSKNMIPYLGLKRTLTSSSTYDNDGVRVFAPDKLVAELFQDASAPQGHFIRNAWRPNQIVGGAVISSIADWSLSAFSPGVQTVTVETESPHGLAGGDTVTITGAEASVTYVFPGYPEPVDATFSISGSWEVESIPDTTHFTFEMTLSDYVSWAGFNNIISLGTVSAPVTGGTSDNSPFRPVTSAFYAGRVWYAGCPYKKQAGRIYFSQIIENDAQYGKCYQVADPTDERISDIVASDGGVINIPEVGNVLKILPYGSFLLVFATKGVWQIGGNSSSGFFSAVSYSIRKITESGCVSGQSVVLGDNVPYYSGTSDIYVIVEDSNSGLLVAQNVTQTSIHTLYAAALSKETIQAEYDEVERKIVWLYQSTSSIPRLSYDKALCLSTVLGAFTKYAFHCNSAAYVASVTSMRDASTNKKLKYICITDSGTVLNIAECNNTVFVDLSLTEKEAFIVSGPETLGDASKYRYAPYIWVFSKKTETGFVQDSEGGLTPVAESSTKMQARWDWADLSVNGKWGSVQEVYRHLRMYQPASAADTFDDGVPLVVTRNKVRGRGRSLQIKLYAGQGKDSFIAGWHVKHDVHTET